MVQPGMLTVRPISESDVDCWLKLRCELLPEEAESAHRGEFDYQQGDVNRPEYYRPCDSIEVVTSDIKQA
jgi:hypothetical protein